MPKNPYQDAAATYRDHAVTTASPAKLVVLIFQRLTLDLERALHALETDQSPHTHLIHAQDLLVALLDALDLDAWEHAPPTRQHLPHHPPKPHHREHRKKPHPHPRQPRHHHRTHPSLDPSRNPSRRHATFETTDLCARLEALKIPSKEFATLKAHQISRM